MLNESNQGYRKALGSSAVNAELIVDTPVQIPALPQRLDWIGVHYTSGPVHQGITIEIISAEGPDFNTRLLKGKTDDQFLFYQPDATLNIASGDVIRVTAPAGGPTVTSHITVQMKEEGTA